MSNVFSKTDPNNCANAVDPNVAPNEQQVDNQTQKTETVEEVINRLSKSLPPMEHDSRWGLNREASYICY